MKNIYFAADFHLGARYLADPKEHERRVVAWLREIAPTARKLYLLGDILDYWYEYRTVVPRGFTRFFGEIARMVDSGIEVVWLKGNHDIWTFGYLEQELGVRVVDGMTVEEIDGHRFLLEHGDGVGKMKPGFRVMRAVFRNRFAQWLFSAIHPRWSVAFAHRWSSSSRGSHNGSEGAFNPATDALVAFAEEYNAIHVDKIDYFVFGHRHITVDLPLDYGRMIVVSDWFQRGTYAEWDGSEMRLRVRDFDINTI